MMWSSTSPSSTTLDECSRFSLKLVGHDSVQSFKLISNHPFFRLRPDFCTWNFVIRDLDDTHARSSADVQFVFSSYVARKLLWIGNKRANDAKFCIFRVQTIYKIFTRVVLRYNSHLVAMLLSWLYIYSVCVWVPLWRPYAMHIMRCLSHYSYYYDYSGFNLVFINCICRRPSIRARRIRSVSRKCDDGNAQSNHPFKFRNGILHFGRERATPSRQYSLCKIIKYGILCAGSPFVWLTLAHSQKPGALDPERNGWLCGRGHIATATGDTKITQMHKI